MSAWDLVWSAVYNKQQYEAAAASGMTETGGNPGNTLDQLHRANTDIENQLSGMGYADAAQAVSSNNAAGLSQWANAHAQYLQGTSGGGSNTVPGGGQPQVQPPTVTPPGGGQGYGADAKAVGAAIANFFSGIGTLFANPGGWFQSLGQGFGAGVQAAGQGVGTAATTAGTGLGQGAINAKPLVIAAVAILALLWLDKGVRIKENRTSVREGRGLFGYKP